MSKRLWPIEDIVADSLSDDDSASEDDPAVVFIKCPACGVVFSEESAELSDDPSLLTRTTQESPQS